MEVSPQDLGDLRDTLQRVQQKGRKYVDFTDDVTSCKRNKVWEQLNAAQDAATRREARNQRNPVRRFMRKMGGSASILSPGLAAIPDHLNVVQGGLALIFSVRLTCPITLQGPGHAKRRLNAELENSWLDTVNRIESRSSMPFRVFPTSSKWRKKSWHRPLGRTTTQSANHYASLSATCTRCSYKQCLY